MSSLVVGGGEGEVFASKYCRMCAAQITHGVQIFGEEGRQLQLSQQIRKTLAILVSKITF